MALDGLVLEAQSGTFSCQKGKTSFVHISGILDGPHDQGPFACPTGQWWLIDMSVMCAKEMSQNSAHGHRDSDVQTAYHGANLAALASIWSKE
eukprot:9321590-Pyramimonas_sp.AAC.1